MSEDMPENLVSCFPIRLQGVIKEIFTDGKIGISPQSMKIHLTTTKVVEDPVDYRKSFVLEIPYASKQLYWEIVFSDEDDGFPPDFEFPNDQFLCDPEPDVISNCIPSLAGWNVNNPKSLVNTIRELLVLYKKMQITTLQERQMYAQLADEYNLLLTKLKIPEGNIEVYVDRNGAVHFLINLCVDFSSLPPYIQPILLGNDYNLLNPCEDSAVLRISVLRSDGNRYTSDLQLSPRLEQVIGSSSTLHIPKMNKEKSLSAYVLEVRKLLTGKVDTVSNHYSMRKEYIQILLSRCARNIIEYNNKLFTQASIFAELESFPILIIISIGKNFPQEKPKVVLCSVFHTHNSRPSCNVVESYPYSPRWKAQEMVDRLLNHLNSETGIFFNNYQNSFDTEVN